MEAAPSLSQLREGLHTSVSQVKSYLICPHKHFLQYIRGVEPEFRPSSLVFGVSVHAALADYYIAMQQTGSLPPLELLADSFADCWTREQDKPVPINYDSEDQDGAFLDTGIGLLSAFYENARLEQVIAVEAPFALDLVDPRTGESLDVKLIGAADLLTISDGQPMIWDHKSIGKRYTSAQLAFDIQPSVYVHAFRDEHGDLPQFQFQCLIKTKKPGWQLNRVERNERDVWEAMSTILEVQHAIEQGVHYRVRGWACSGCPLRWACDQEGC